MLPPHGNELIDRFVTHKRAEELKSEFEDMPVVTLDQNLVYDFLNIAQGVYSPIRGFMSRNDFMKVINDLTLESGVAWPLPIVLDIGSELAGNITPNERIGIRGPDGTPLGIMDVDSIYKYDKKETCRKLFGTVDTDHPGVRTVNSKSSFFAGGEIKAFPDIAPKKEDRYLSPKETRVLFNKLGWDTVVGFQTRNVPHRAHEYLQKTALEHVDGLLIQPKIGDKKPTDYTNNAILEGYRTLIENYYPTDSVSLSIFKSRMWYAGPREAVFDAIARKNYGCTHFIIGRDHAGVGNYYGDFEAQRLFNDVGEVGIEPVYYHYAFYCDVCDGVVSEKICPHEDKHHIEPSGTKIRRLLSNGERPSEKMMRPEVSEKILTLDQILMG